MTKKITLLFLSLIFFVPCFAQKNKVKKSKAQHIEINSDVEGSILQFTKLINDNKTITTTPRYTLFFNGGVDANYKISNHFKVFTGICFKNIGLIDKYDDTLKVKRRMYTMGAPLGLKIKVNENLKFKLGADFNLVFNYKEKVFRNGDKTAKFNEFFSNKTPLFYPSIFAGITIYKISLTANYYPNNFFNTDYNFYNKMDAKLFTISAGIHLENQSKK
jgi:hypothetical protein